MSEVFTASNGVTVHELKADNMTVGFGGDTHEIKYLGTQITPALREYFQYERDKELGLWRWPKNPHWIVKKLEENLVDVIDERTYDSWGVTRRAAYDPANDFLHLRIARAYFDAHPETKPWHSAKDGEAWAITNTDGETVAVLCVEFDDGTKEFNRFDSDSGTIYETDVKSPAITHAERIWPVNDDD